MELEGKEEYMQMKSRVERRVTLDVREGGHGEDEMSGRLIRERWR